MSPSACGFVQIKFKMIVNKHMQSDLEPVIKQEIHVSGFKTSEILRLSITQF
jgi:hypothetical protein